MMTFDNMLAELVTAYGADKHIAIRVLDGIPMVVFERCNSLAAFILLAGNYGLVMISEVILWNDSIPVLNFFMGDMAFAVILLHKDITHILFVPKYKRVDTMCKVLPMSRTIEFCTVENSGRR